MSNVVFGEVDWNSGDVGGPKSDFMRLEEGESVVRVMGNPVQFYIHWVTTPDGSKRKVNSPVDAPELVRRLEDSGFRRQARWLIKVLDRTDNEFKLLEVGSQIYNGVRALYNNQKWGKVTAYDVSINRGPKGSQPLYGVTPNPKEALGTEFKSAFVSFNDRVNVDKMITPSTSEFICELMGWDDSNYVSESDTSGTTEGGDEFDFDFE
jgi:hypothetical protein|tara:strand:- start:10124 stop:10747 length:624 start_codon:yes stop_codon:yes gene_type:complete